jgi:hypothetical protein
MPDDVVPAWLRTALAEEPEQCDLHVAGRVVTDDGPIFTVRPDGRRDEFSVGMRMRALWDDVTEAVTLLRFTPVIRTRP